MSHSGAAEKASEGPGCCSFPTLQGVGAQDSTDSQGKASETALCPAGHGKDLLSPGAGLPVSVGCVAGYACSWLQAFELMDSCCISLNSVTKCKRMCAEMQLYPRVPKMQAWLTSMCPTQLRIINLDVKPLFSCSLAGPGTLCCQRLAAIRAVGGKESGAWENKEGEGLLASGEGSLECEMSP